MVNDKNEHFFEPNHDQLVDLAVEYLKGLGYTDEEIQKEYTFEIPGLSNTKMIIDVVAIKNNIPEYAIECGDLHDNNNLSCQQKEAALRLYFKNYRFFPYNWFLINKIKDESYEKDLKISRLKKQNMILEKNLNNCKSMFTRFVEPASLPIDVVRYGIELIDNMNSWCYTILEWFSKYDLTMKDDNRDVFNANFKVYEELKHLVDEHKNLNMRDTTCYDYSCVHYRKYHEYYNDWTNYSAQTFLLRQISGAESVLFTLQRKISHNGIANKNDFKQIRKIIKKIDKYKIQLDKVAPRRKNGNIINKNAKDLVIKDSIDYAYLFDVIDN